MNEGWLELVFSESVFPETLNASVVTLAASPTEPPLSTLTYTLTGHDVAYLLSSRQPILGGNVQILYLHPPSDGVEWKGHQRRHGTTGCAAHEREEESHCLLPALIIDLSKIIE